MQVLVSTILALTGCSSKPPLPAGVAEGAVRIASDGQQISVRGEPVALISELARGPTEPTAPEVAEALAGAAGEPVWVHLPADTPFWLVRQVLNAASEAGDVWISAAPDGEAFAISPPPVFSFGGGCEAPVPVKGVEPLITVSIQAGSDGAWVLATARLIPITASGPTDGLDADCLAIPPCEELFPEGPLRSACAAQQAPAPQRVTLGGELGCLLPIAREPGDVAAWRPELARLIGVLGLGERPLRVVMPEALSRLDAVLAVVGGFVDAGLPPPSIGTVLLVEGNDGPPVCNATVRDREALALAGARWVGGMRAWKQAPEVGAAQEGAPGEAADGAEAVEAAEPGGG
jgi:hypothetical protein